VNNRLNISRFLQQMSSIFRSTYRDRSN